MVILTKMLPVAKLHASKSPKNTLISKRIFEKCLFGDYLYGT